MAMNNQAAVDKNSREYLTQQKKGGRTTLLLILAFTVLNLVLLALDQGTQFLFCASVPYYLTMIGKGIDNGFADGAWPENGTYTVTALVISALILAVYLLCWILSKKRAGWLTAALVLFAVDTVALIAVSFLLLENPAANIMDLVIHVVAIWELWQALRANRKLAQLPQEPPVTAEGWNGTTSEPDA